MHSSRQKPRYSAPMPIVISPSVKHPRTSSSNATSSPSYTSPELVFDFEMSPLNDSSSDYFTLPKNTRHLRECAGPYRYPFASASPRYDAQPERPPLAPRAATTPVHNHMEPSIPVYSRGRQPTRNSSALSSQRDRTKDSASDVGSFTSPVKLTARTKIVGFTPPNPSPKNQGLAPTQKPRRKVSPLYPVRRCSSFSASPWILPGASGEVESLSLPVDSDYNNAVDFEKYMLQRIENHRTGYPKFTCQPDLSRLP